ncbi:hypothetical protein V2I01_09810 [Micromonospora sp. BRA006-A]|nr:hypothetical protein [Micromonospora sp. BRA006-A]
MTGPTCATARNGGTRPTSTSSPTRSRGVVGRPVRAGPPAGDVLPQPEVRDWLRRRSQWEVRVAKYRSVPPPPDPQRCGFRGGPPIRP